MIAKLISRGATRDEAIDGLIEGLDARWSFIR
jgi:acetyl/propionyl-CoA carboxylase alpha subunit